MIYESTVIAFEYLSNLINNRRYRLRIKQTEFSQELLDAYK